MVSKEVAVDTSASNLAASVRIEVTVSVRLQPLARKDSVAGGVRLLLNELLFGGHPFAAAQLSGSKLPYHGTVLISSRAGSH